MECLICGDKGDEPLKKNTVCPCNYERHDSCWIDYVHSLDTVKCPTCRRVLSSKKQPPRQQVPRPQPQQTQVARPATQQPVRQEVTYQPLPAAPQRQQSTPSTIPKKDGVPTIVKVLCVAAILITIIVLIAVL